MLLRLAACVALLCSTPAYAADWPARWSAPAEPLTLVPHLHFVGTEGIGVFLITTPAGHVLIDGAMPSSGSLIAGNIERLGFRLQDVKLLVNSHAHFDHAGGLAELKRRTGAIMLASAADRPALESGGVDYGATRDVPFPAVKVDRVVRDGETLRIGGVTLRAWLTPGHTKGCTTWTADLPGPKARRVHFHCSSTVAGQDLHGDPHYPTAAADFRRTFARLKRMKADVFLGGHTEFFDFAGKADRLRAGETDAFVDPGELRRHVEATERAFLKTLDATRPSPVAQ